LPGVFREHCAEFEFNSAKLLQLLLVAVIVLSAEVPTAMLAKTRLPVKVMTRIGMGVPVPSLDG